MIPQYHIDSLRRRAAAARQRHDDAAQAGICPYLSKLPIEEEYEKALQANSVDPYSQLAAPQGSGWTGFSHNIQNPQGTGKSFAKPLPLSKEIPTPTPLQVIGALLRIIENARFAILAINHTGDTSRDLEEAPKTSGWEDLLRSLRKEEQETYNLRRRK